MSKVKQFFSKPLYLMITAVSVVMLAVVSVLAFNALAADPVELPDGYTTRNFGIFYYNNYSYTAASKLETGYTELGDEYVELAGWETNDEGNKWTNDNWTTEYELGSVEGDFDGDGSNDYVSAFKSGASYKYQDVTIIPPTPSDEYRNQNLYVYSYCKKTNVANYAFRYVGYVNVGAVFDYANSSGNLYGTFFNINGLMDMAEFEESDVSVPSDYGEIINTLNWYITCTAPTDDTKFIETGTSSDGYTCIPGAWAKYDFLLTDSNIPDSESLRTGISIKARVLEEYIYASYDLNYNSEGNFSYTTVPVDLITNQYGDAYLRVSDESGSFSSDFVQISNYMNQDHISTGIKAFYFDEYNNAWAVTDDGTTSSWNDLALPISLTVKYDYGEEASYITDDNDLNQAKIMINSYDEYSEIYKPYFNFTNNWENVLSAYTTIDLHDGTLKQTAANGQTKIYYTKDGTNESIKSWLASSGQSTTVLNLGETISINELCLSRLRMGNDSFEFDPSSGYWNSTVSVSPVFDATYVINYNQGDVYSVTGMPGSTVLKTSDFVDGSYTLSVAAPKADGYKFDGWKHNGIIVTAVNSADFEGTDGYYTLDLVASWSTIPYYQVMYTYEWDSDVDDSALPSAPYDSNYYPEGATVTVADVLEAEGYIFKGWSLYLEDAMNGKTVTKFEITGDTYIIGYWTKDVKYKLTYKYEGEVPDNAPEVPAEKEYSKYEVVTIEPAPTLEGYTFNGWFNTYYKAEDFTIMEDTELTGSWTVNQYVVEYCDYNGEKIDSLGGSYDYSSEVTIVAVPTAPEGKENGRWVVSTKGEKTTDAAGNEIPASGTFKMPAGKVIFQAEYDDIKHTVTYNSGYDGDQADISENVVYGGTHTVKGDNTFTREGYKFKEWTVSPDSYSKTPGDVITVKNDVTYTAVWEKTYKVTYAYEGTVPAGAKDVPTDSTAYLAGQEVTVAAVPNLTGYTFNGWNKDGNAVTTFNITADTTLTGSWTANQYDVKYYDEDGNELTALSGKHEYASEVTIADVPDAPAGKKNGRWELKNGSATTGSDGKDIPTSGTFKMPADTVSFQAKYDNIEYTITYKSDYTGGPADVTESGILYNETRTVKDYGTFTREGYTLTGWTVEPNGYSVTPNDTITVKDDVTYTANWTINKYDVKYYDADGNELTDLSKSYNYASEVTIADVPTAPEGKENGRWELKADSATTGSDGKDIPTSGKFNMPADTVSFQVKYDNIEYTITYKSDYTDGQTDVTESGILYNETRTVKDYGTFTREGYTLTGWTVEPKGYSVTPNDTITVKDNVTYTAVWTKKVYTITYQPGYENSNQSDKTYNVEYLDSHTVQANTFTRTGYHFNGWELVTPATGYSVTVGDSFEVKENVTYKAVWEKNVHTVTYDITIPSDINYTKPEDANVSYGDTVVVADAPTGFDTNKYEFSGWTSSDVTISGAGDSFTMPDEDVVISGSFTEKGKVTLTYNANGATEGTAPDPVTDYTQVTETIKGQGNLKKTGHSFGGWKDSSGTIYTAGTEHTFTQNTTIYAIWNVEQYNVEYYDINGDKIASYSESPLYNTDVTIRPASDIPSVTGKTAAGWVLTGDVTSGADGNAIIVANGTFKMPADTVKFQASYTDNNYTVTYQVSNKPESYNVPETKTYKYGDKVNVAEIPSVEGYDFTGWSCADSDVDVTKASFTMPARNVVITGVFTKLDTVTLTYLPNGGTPETAVPASKWAYTKLTAKIENHTGLTKTGYKFDGWNTKSDGSGTAYEIGKTYDFTANTELYAQWSKDSFKVEYYQQNGTTLIDSAEYEYEAAVTVGYNVTAPDVEGYDFKGWTLIDSAQKDADGNEIGSSTGYPMPAETVRYKAEYTPKTYTVTYRVEGDLPSGYVAPANASYSYGDTVNVESVPTEEGYTFTGWNYNDSGVYYAKDTDKASFVIKENVVLKGVWTKDAPEEPKKATIIYSSGLEGDDITEPSLSLTYTETVIYGNDYTVHDNEGFTNYVRPGYKFVSWKVAAPKITGFSLLDNLAARFIGPATVGQTLVGGDTLTGLSEDITLEAQWEKVYTLTYDANGADNPEKIHPQEEYTEGYEATVKGQGDIVKNDFEFLYWSTTPDDSDPDGRFNANDSIKMDSDITLYAVWKTNVTDDPDPVPDKFVVHYDKNGADKGTAPADKEYEANDTVNVEGKGDLTREGYTFKEWNTKANGKGQGYSNPALTNAPASFTMPESDVTLYAIWVDENGNIPSPGTGEAALGIYLALGAMIISGAGASFIIFRRKRKCA